MTIQPDIATLQRVVADGAITARSYRGITRVDRLWQEGAAKIRLPARDAGPLEAVLINTAGGLTGGDRIAWTVNAGEDTAITLTTQACEKVYRSSGGRAEAENTIRAASGSKVSWLPQETIVYDRSALSRMLNVDLAADAEALLLEATVFGRQAMGENVHFAEFRDRWRVRVGGSLVHCEDFRISGDITDILSHNATAAGARAFATLLVIRPDVERLVEPARAIIGSDGGASSWTVGGTGKLLARLASADGYSLRQRLVPLVGLLNGQAGLPKIWST